MLLVALGGRDRGQQAHLDGDPRPDGEYLAILESPAVRLRARLTNSGVCVCGLRCAGAGIAALFGLGSVYEVVLAHELRSRGLHVERQLSIPVRYGNLVFDEGFRADLVINNKLIVEVKSVEATKAVHKKQLLTYLRLAIHRVVNGLEE